MPPIINAVIFVGLPVAGVGLLLVYCPGRTQTLLTCAFCSGSESHLQELMWAGVKVATISARSHADTGGDPGVSRMPAGCVYIASQFSNLPAALRCEPCQISFMLCVRAPQDRPTCVPSCACRTAAGKLGVLLCHALVLLAQDLYYAGLDKMPDMNILHGSRTVNEVQHALLDSVLMRQQTLRTLPFKTILLNSLF